MQKREKNYRVSNGLTIEFRVRVLKEIGEDQSNERDDKRGGAARSRRRKDH